MALAGFLVAASVAACAGSTSVEPGPGAQEAASSPSASASAPTASASAIPAVPDADVDAWGNVRKRVGESADLLTAGGEVAATITVHGADVLSTCPGEFAERPLNGSFVVADVSVEVTPALGVDELLLVGPAMWAIRGSDEALETDLETSSAWTCFATEQRLPSTVAPDEIARGYLVLDAATTTGHLVYLPNGAAGWSWPLG